MQHHYNPFSRAMTTHWMLTELDADHEQIMVNVEAGETRTPAFRAINPMGKVPTLVDDGVVVTEVAAICAYLADKHPAAGFAPPPGSAERGRYYRYLFFPGTTLEPMFTTRLLGLTDYRAETVGWGDFERCMDTVEAMTPASGWALEHGFGAADVVFGGSLDYAIQFGWLEAPSDRVKAYVARLKQRSAYRASHHPSWH